MQQVWLPVQIFSALLQRLHLLRFSLVLTSEISHQTHKPAQSITHCFINNETARLIRVYRLLIFKAREQTPCGKTRERSIISQSSSRRTAANPPSAHYTGHGPEKDFTGLEQRIGSDPSLWSLHLHQTPHSDQNCIIRQIASRDTHTQRYSPTLTLNKYIKSCLMIASMMGTTFQSLVSLLILSLLSITYWSPCITMILLVRCLRTPLSVVIPELCFGLSRVRLCSSPEGLLLQLL